MLKVVIPAICHAGIQAVSDGRKDGNSYGFAKVIRVVILGARIRGRPWESRPSTRSRSSDRRAIALRRPEVGSFPGRADEALGWGITECAPTRRLLARLRDANARRAAVEGAQRRTLNRDTINFRSATMSKSIIVKLSLLLAVCAALSLTLRSNPVRATGSQSNQAPRQIDFNRDIRPILSDKCWSCHGPDAPNKKIKLRLDSEASARADLGRGRHAIVPGHPDESELVRRITSEKEIVRMPPADSGRTLTKSEIELLTEWIRQGARWQKHWSFVPPERPTLPTVRNRTWPRNPIDHFVLARLEKEGLSPSPEADRAALIRRVSFDLTGLPPSLAEIDAFINDRAHQCLRESRRPPARQPAVRRANGVQMAGCGTLRRHQRLSDRRRAQYVALARLGDRSVQPKPAVRSVHDRTAGR